MPACHSGGVGSIAGHPTWDLRGTGFFAVNLSAPLSVSFSQRFVLIHYCAYWGKSAKAGKLKQSGTVPDIRKGRECWKRKYFVIVLGPPDG
jgi:hypothetical protein